MKSKFRLQCTKCSFDIPPVSKSSVCPECGGALETIYDYDAIRETFTKGVLDKRQPSVWKYIELLPLEDPARAVTLGEGGTRLLHARRLGEELGSTRLYLKDETKNPTGSFKDRKSTVAISKASELGFPTVISATAGNAGASIAAYAARAGLRAVILAFRVITKPKLAKLICYGADVLIVDGTSWEVFQLTCAASKKCGWYNIVAASRYNPYVKDGAKTECIEICEQLGWNAPDWLIVPVGGGCGLASCWKAVRELHRIGLIDKLPRMVGVQGAHCAPLVKAFDEKLPPDRIERFPNAHTVAHSIEDDYPPDGDQALIAIRESEGLALSIEDVTMLAAQALMAKKEGLFVEPASSATVAATRMLLEQGIIDRKDSIIAVATGSGLNEPDSVFSAFPQPPIIKPDIRELEVNLRGFR